MSVGLPVVVLVNGKRTTDQTSSENRCVDGNQLPHGRVVVGEDLELCVQVKVEEDEASKSSSGVARWHGLQAVVDLLLVTRADAAVEHDLAVAVSDIAVDAELVAIVCLADSKAFRDDWLADCEEVRAETANKPLDEDLEDGSGDERVQQTDGSVVDVPEAAGADLNDQEDNERNEERHQSGGVDGNDLGRSV